MIRQQYKHLTFFVILVSCITLVVSGCGKNDSGSTETGIKKEIEAPKEIPVPSSAPITEEKTF